MVREHKGQLQRRAAAVSHTVELYLPAGVEHDLKTKILHVKIARFGHGT